MILEIAVGLMAFLKIVFNYVESEKAIKIFGRLDDVINFFVKDKVKKKVEAKIQPKAPTKIEPKIEKKVRYKSIKKSKK